MKGLHFVCMDPGLPKDPKIAEMAKALRKDRFWVAGRFLPFFGEVAVNAPDGRIGHLDPDLLDDWAGGVKGWGVLVQRLLCDRDGVLSAWERYNGRALRRLKRDRDRKMEQVEEAGSPKGTSAITTNVGPGMPPELRGNVTETPRQFHGISTEIPRKIRGNSTPTGTIQNEKISVGESSPELSPYSELREESAPARAGAARSLGVAA